MSDTSLERALRARIDAGGRAFIPYVTAGLAGVDADLLRAIEAAGADALEVGIPFSDPVMDGGVIQEASRLALASGFRVADSFALVRDAALSIPVVFMTYLNPVVTIGYRGFLDAAAEAGAAGFIVPDLPVDEGDEWTKMCAERQLASVYLAAPGTEPSRLGRVAEASTGFVYCVSTYGVTGTRQSLSGDSKELVEALRPMTARPLVIGVGVSTPEHAREAADFADGVIVGSALVKRLLEGDRRGTLDAAAEFREALG